MDSRQDMNGKFERSNLLKQLEEVLDVHGARAACWPEGCRARLCALVETDQEAARLHAEAKALERVLCCGGRTGPQPELEECILAAARCLPQQGGEPGGATILNFADKPGRRAFRRDRPDISVLPRRAFWGGAAAMLAASLVLGVYIGASGEAVPTLRNIELMATNDIEGDVMFSTPVFAPQALEGREQL